MLHACCPDWLSCTWGLQNTLWHSFDLISQAQRKIFTHTSNKRNQNIRHCFLYALQLSQSIFSPISQMEESIFSYFASYPCFSWNSWHILSTFSCTDTSTAEQAIFFWGRKRKINLILHQVKQSKLHPPVKENTIWISCWLQSYPLFWKLTWCFFLMFVCWKLNQSKFKSLPSLCSYLSVEEMELKATAGYIDIGLLKEFSLHEEKRKSKNSPGSWEDEKKIEEIKPMA